MERKEAIERLQKLIGKELHKLAKEFGVTIYKNGRVNKGWAGHVFERHLELPINSAQSPNFGSWELKSIPLKYLKNGNLVFKETMAITMIDPVNVKQKKFIDSHLFSKLKKALVVVRTVGKTVDDDSFIHSIVEFDLKNELYKAVEEDYNLVRDAIIGSGFNTLTGKMGKYIQPRTKGTGHGSITRAFYARKEFLKEFIKL
jgi:DNA mismatch repair protein MutH